MDNSHRVADRKWGFWCVEFWKNTKGEWFLRVGPLVVCPWSKVRAVKRG
jgi:hypothetical protein